MAINVSVSFRSRDHYKDLGTTMPIVHKEGAKFGIGVGLVLVGLVFVVFSVVGWLIWWPSNPPGSENPLLLLIFLGIFSIIGCGVMVAGVAAFVHGLEIRIDRDNVRGLKRGLSGTHRWTDPLTEYLGVLADEEYHPGDGDDPSYTLYKITLRHSNDDRRNVLLYCDQNAHDHRAKTEAFGRALGVPVVVETGDDRFEARAPGDLDKPIAQLVEEGKLAFDFDPQQVPVSDLLTVERSGERFVFTHRHNKASALFATALFLAIGLGLLYWYFGPGLPTGGEGSPWVVPLVGACFAAIGLYGLVFVGCGKSILTVMPEEVRSRSVLGGWTLTEKRMPAASIEEARLQAKRGKSRELLVVGDGKSLKFGSNLLSKQELSYMRNCIVATVAGASS